MESWLIRGWKSRKNHQGRGGETERERIITSGAGGIMWRRAKLHPEWAGPAGEALARTATLTLHGGRKGDTPPNRLNLPGLKSKTSHKSLSYS